MGRESAYGQARQRLIETAAAVVHDSGHAASVDAFAAAAGVTKRTVYQHFPSKEELVAESLAERSRRWREWVPEELARRAAPGAGRVLALFDLLAEETDAAGPAPFGYRGCTYANTAAQLPDPAAPARRVASDHKAGVLRLVDRLLDDVPGVGNRPALARRLKLLAEGAIATALVDPGRAPFEDAKAMAALLLDQPTDRDEEDA
jgi:AcrR family transcriptional regulator